MKEYNGKKNNTDVKGLRSAMDWLKSQCLLLETDKEGNGDLEITGIQKHFDGSLPILFNNVKGYGHLRAVTNLFAKTTVMNKMFGWPDDTERTKALAFDITLAPVEVSEDEAPAQHHVIRRTGRQQVGARHPAHTFGE